MKQIVFTEKAPAAIGPYSQAVLSNGTLYVSGQIALAKVEAGANIEDETKQVMENMKAILEAANMAFENVVKCSIFVKDMNNFAKINSVYGEYFPTNPPARETVEVARLPKDVNVEISCVAAI
jgi:2-iminobutanoate/2-iminopropanoate deaminase